MIEARRRRELVALARELRARGLTVSSCGNLSVRSRRRDGMLITPTRVDPDRLRPRDVVACGLGGRARRGTPSLEWALHAEIYRARPDVLAVAHTHSPAAIARSFARAPLCVDTEEAQYLGWGPIRIAPLCPPGSPALAAAVVAALGHDAAVLLERHGVVAVGATPREALEHAAVVEHLARIDLMVDGEVARGWARAAAR